MSVARLVVVRVGDSVGVCVDGARPGDEVRVPDGPVIVVGNDIPPGHKVALRAHAAGEAVVKYGASIGVASRPIAVGEHVHVHNVDSARVRT
jgi:altronate hydrolase